MSEDNYTRAEINKMFMKLSERLDLMDKYTGRYVVLTEEEATFLQEWIYENIPKKSIRKRIDLISRRPLSAKTMIKYLASGNTEENKE